ncbi:MAG: regulatory protein RecX [Rubrivivax sp.]
MRPPPSLRQRALMWLAQREHSRKELHDKLVRWLQATQGARSQAAVGPSPAAPREEPACEEPACEEPACKVPACKVPACQEPVIEEQIHLLLDELARAGHLSDARALESRIHVRSGRFGNLRIERELRHLGMQADEPVRQALRATELERARGVWARKFAGPPASAAERARQMRFLAGRGFTAETIRAVLGGSRGEDDEIPGPG